MGRWGSQLEKLGIIAGYIAAQASCRCLLFVSKQNSSLLYRDGRRDIGAELCRSCQCRVQPVVANKHYDCSLNLQPVVRLAHWSLSLSPPAQRLKIFQTFQCGAGGGGAGGGWDSRRAAWARARARTPANRSHYLSVEESLPLSFSHRRPHSPLSPRTRWSHRSSSPYSFSRSRNLSEPDDDMVGHIYPWHLPPPSP